MPLTWKRGENPYRTNYFGILELGATAKPGMITTRGKNLVTKLQHGGKVVVDGREVSEAEINEAESRLRDERHWAPEVMLVHPVSASENTRLQQMCKDLIEEATPPFAPPRLQLRNIRALAGFIPPLTAEDVDWPDWDELGIPGPDSPEDRQCDIQFDL